MNATQHYNGLQGFVNGKVDALQPGEFRVGDVRMYPQTNANGETTVRLHVTNEVDMLIARNRYALIKALTWIVISAFFCGTAYALTVYFAAR